MKVERLRAELLQGKRYHWKISYHDFHACTHIYMQPLMNLLKLTHIHTHTHTHNHITPSPKLSSRVMSALSGARGAELCLSSSPSPSAAEEGPLSRKRERLD